MSVALHHRFDAPATVYGQHRPDYPPALFDWIAARVPPPCRALDLATGTGIVARALAARGYAVTGLDPSPGMLAEARSRAAGGTSWVRGAAEHLPFADRSFGLVASGQAFHWFDLDRVLPELRRLAGRAVAFWNVRAESPFMQAYDALLRAHSSEYGLVPSARDGLARLRAHPAAGIVAEESWPHAQHLDRGGLVGRAFSSSYVAHGVADRDGFTAGLHALFDAHAAGGTIVFPYRTQAVLFAP